MVSIVIVQYNNPDLTKQCISSLRKHCPIPHEIILVDNNSENPDARVLEKEIAKIRFIQSRVNDGFGKGNNTGAAIARGNILLFLNNDTITEENFFTPINEMFETDSSIGIVGPRLSNRDHSLQLSAGSLPSIVNEMKDKILYRYYEAGHPFAVRRARKQFSVTQEVEWVTGAALFIRRGLFERLKGFDEGFFMFFEDKDLCLRARSLGAKVMYSAGTSLVHLRGASAGDATDDIYRKSQMRYYEKHRNCLEQMILKNYLRYRRRSLRG